MEFVSLGGIGDDTALADELRRLGCGIGWWRWENVPDSEVLHAVLPDDPAKAARCRELIEQARDQ
jgi:hypothetical protein